MKKILPSLLVLASLTLASTDLCDEYLTKADIEVDGMKSEEFQSEEFLIHYNSYLNYSNKASKVCPNNTSISILQANEILINFVENN